ncbi:unnamed protein product [Penicillium crustosum]
MSDFSGTPDLECFEALRDETFEAMGPSARVIRTLIACHIKTIQVVKYLRFTNVPPSVAEQDFSKSTRPMYNDETPKATLIGVLGIVLHEMGLLTSIIPTGSVTC